MFASSVSASRPCIAFKSCASSIVYSAFNARVTAVTVCFSIEKAISANTLVDELSPNASPCAAVIPVAVSYVPADGLSLRTAGLVAVSVISPPPVVPCAFWFEKSCCASSTSISAPVCEDFLDLIAKISPVGPVIGCTPQMSYAIKFGIALLTSEIKIGSQLSIEVPVLFSGAASDRNALSSLSAFSWFSRIKVVTALL